MRASAGAAVSNTGVAPLLGLPVTVAPDPAAVWAGDLLASLGADVLAAEQMPLLVGPDAAVGRRRSSEGEEWARSGAMMLTGRTDGPALPAPGTPAVAARGAAFAFRVLAGRALAGLDGARLLGERADLAGLVRCGTISPGGGCRLLPTADGTVALSLARADDDALVGALIEAEVGTGAGWERAAAWLRGVGAAAAAERAALLGLPCAVVPAGGAETACADRGSDETGGHAPWRLTRLGPASPGRATRQPLVLDLSSLWAGPLCAQLLGLAGARVVKVESTGRPDGARAGNRALYDLLHAGHESVALDLGSPRGRADLLRLIRAADVVVDSSRPRALRQLGVVAEDLVAARPGLTWVAISAYGRSHPWAERPGYGDDVAAAAGLVARDRSAHVFAGDAIADPLTGLHAAVAALASVRAGGGVLLDVGMYAVARACLAGGPPGRSDPAPAHPPLVAAPVSRPVPGAAAAPGVDTARVLTAL